MPTIKDLICWLTSGDQEVPNRTRASRSGPRTYLSCLQTFTVYDLDAVVFNDGHNNHDLCRGTCCRHCGQDVQSELATHRPRRFDLMMMDVQKSVIETSLSGTLLKSVINKYTPRRTVPPDSEALVLVFTHGTGFRSSVVSFVIHS